MKKRYYFPEARTAQVGGDTLWTMLGIWVAFPLLVMYYGELMSLLA